MSSNICVILVFRLRATNESALIFTPTILQQWASFCFRNGGFSHFGIKHFRHTVFNLPHLCYISPCYYCIRRVLECKCCLIAPCWNVGVKCPYLRDIPVHWLLMRVIIIFLCWLVLIFDFFINHSCMNEHERWIRVITPAGTCTVHYMRQVCKKKQKKTGCMFSVL